MVRTSNKSDKQSAPAPAATTSASSSVDAAAAAQKKAKKPKVSAATTATVAATPAPVVVEPVLTNEIVETAPGETSSITVKMTEFGAKLQQLVGLFSTVKSDYKTLEKLIAREIKIAQKTSSKKKKSTGNRQPSGFVKPTRISDELAQFLGKSVGTEMARTEVSKEINAYIRTNNLQDSANGRMIHPDVKLSVLLKFKAGDELTYFNLQRYMKHHFVKAGDAATSSVSSV